MRATISHVNFMLILKFAQPSTRISPSRSARVRSTIICLTSTYHLILQHWQHSFARDSSSIVMHLSRCTVSCNMDCCEALPWTATRVDRTDHWRLFNGFNKISCLLLCRVSSSEFWLFSVEVPCVLDMQSFLPYASAARCLQSFWYASLSLTPASGYSLPFL